jgi:hypothetical protein
MERETIERLAIDCVLGELNEDAATLFEAYLAEHAEAKQWAEPMMQTCTRTREAIAQKTQVAEAAVQPEPIRLPQANWSALGRWAAVIAVSTLFGVTVGRWSMPSQTQKPDTVVARTGQPDAGPEGWRRVLSQSGQGFWQTKAVAMLQSQPRGIPGSTESQRSLWDRYRQFRKTSYGKSRLK